MLPLQDVTHVMKDVSSKTADRCRDISAWRSVQGGDLEEYTDSAAILPPALHLGPCTGPVHRDQGAGFTALIKWRWEKHSGKELEGTVWGCGLPEWWESV